jgi:hypothetical protein
MAASASDDQVAADRVAASPHRNRLCERRREEQQTACAAALQASAFHLG